MKKAVQLRTNIKLFLIENKGRKYYNFHKKNKSKTIESSKFSKNYKNFENDYVFNQEISSANEVRSKAASSQ